MTFKAIQGLSKQKFIRWYAINQMDKEFQRWISSPCPFDFPLPDVQTWKECQEISKRQQQTPVQTDEEDALEENIPLKAQITPVCGGKNIFEEVTDVNLERYTV